MYKGQYELKAFQNLYTQTKSFDADGKRQPVGGRQTYFTSIIEASYGLNQRLNIGISAWIKSVKVSSEEKDSPLKVFVPGERNNHRTAFSNLGPRIKWLPFRKLGNLSFQHSVMFSLAKDADGSSNGRPFLDFDATQFINQIFYDKQLARKVRLFAAFDSYLRLDIGLDKGESNFATDIKAIVSYLPNSKWTIYGSSEWAQQWGTPTFQGHYLQLGTGVKYLVRGNLEVELLYTNFVLGKSQGAGQTYNLGLRKLF